MKKIQSTRKCPPKFYRFHLSRWLTRSWWCQIKFLYLFFMFIYIYINQWSNGKITGCDTDDLSSIPGNVRFFTFQIFNSSIYVTNWAKIIATADVWWLCCQSVELMVKRSIPVQPEFRERTFGYIMDCCLVGANHYE
jgi:hypothetical protein